MNQALFVFLFIIFSALACTAEEEVVWVEPSKQKFGESCLNHADCERGFVCLNNNNDREYRCTTRECLSPFSDRNCSELDQTRVKLGCLLQWCSAVECETNQDCEEKNLGSVCIYKVCQYREE